MNLFTNALTLDSVSFTDIFKSSYLEKVTSFSIVDCLIALGCAFLIGLFIFLIYKKTFSGVLYSRTFNISLVGMLLCTTLVIMGVTSNIVLSLGMVGALSIVRFRTAIKDPVDICFLFWAIAEGILCGAGLIPLAVIGAPIIGVFLLIFMNRQQASNPYLIVIKMNSDETEKAVSEFMRTVFKKLNVKSKTITGGEDIEIVYEVRVSTTNTAFVNDLLKFNGVSSAVMVSYDGNYTA